MAYGFQICAEYRPSEDNPQRYRVRIKAWCGQQFKRERIYLSATDRNDAEHAAADRAQRLFDDMRLAHGH